MMYTALSCLPHGCPLPADSQALPTATFNLPYLILPDLVLPYPVLPVTTERPDLLDIGFQLKKYFAKQDWLFQFSGSVPLNN